MRRTRSASAPASAGGRAAAAATADAEIAGQEGVGVAERPHRDRLDGPGTDPGQRGELLAGPLPVGSDTEIDLAAGERARPGRSASAAAVAAAPAWPGRARPAVPTVGNRREPTARVADGSPCAADQPAGVRAGRGRGHLLAEHRPHGELRTVDRARAPGGPGPWRPAVRAPGRRRADRRPRSGSASRSSSRRQRLIAIARSRRSVKASWQAMWSGTWSQGYDRRDRAAAASVRR